MDANVHESSSLTVHVHHCLGVSMCIPVTHVVTHMVQAHGTSKLACLAAGYAAPSFGLNCAHMAGMREDIIERAAQVMSWFHEYCRLSGYFLILLDL